MTPVGHSLAGLAIGVAVCPGHYSNRARMATLAAFVVLANAPDLPLPSWGHSRYDVSHSVFVTTALAAILAAVLLLAAQTRRALTAPLIFGGAAAWYSHLLLDAMYNHGKGLAMFWPLSTARLALPVPWFATMTLRPIASAHNARVFAVEAIVYGTILALAVAVRRYARRRSR